MPNHTLQILRLLRFAGLMLVLGSVASASAETVGERMKKDPNFRIYAVTFAVTSTTPPVIRAQEVGTLGKKSKHPPKIPDAWIELVKKTIEAQPPKPQMKDGKPVEVFTYFFYVPERPNVIVSDLDKPLDKQPRP
jgi:hypothetical protein